MRFSIIAGAGAFNCNQYLPLIIGRVWELDNLGCEDCDEDEAVRVSILTGTGSTEIVDSQTTRVMEEREWVDGDLAEVSRNFVNQCSLTQDVYYWGEDVCIDPDDDDAMEFPPYVGHFDCGTEGLAYDPGAWRAGIGGAEPGILFPGGAFLLGATYFQEGSDNAQDWAMNEEMGLSVDDPANGTFEDCVLVLDRNWLEDPKSKEGGDEKIYCPGIGMVADEELELTSCTDGGGACSQ